MTNGNGVHALLVMTNKPASVPHAVSLRHASRRRGCQADKLLDFLRYHDADTIYLVGDIVDGWALKSGWYWPQIA